MTDLRFAEAGFSHGLRRVLSEVELRLGGGELVALCGPNGAGKSTLLKLAAGLLAPAEGSVWLDGEPVSRLDARQRAKSIAYLPADSRAAWPMTARRIAALGRIPHLKPLRRLGAEDEAAIGEALERVGAEGLGGRLFNTLSSGEQARILLARALATRAPVLLLDEPTAALDPRHQLAVMDALKAEAARGALVVFAAHALELAAAYADRVLLLAEGEIFADGAPEQVLDEAAMKAVFGVAVPGGVRPTDMRL
jgi:iron complex transport system ATP-binding protein